MAKLTYFTRSVWGRSLIILFFWNLLLRVVAVFGYYLLPERFAPLDFIHSFWQSNYIFWSLANFDGEHYLSIAQFGYGLRGGFPQYAFFPLLPALIHLVSVVIRDYFLSGLLITQTALYLTIVYSTKWVELLRLKNIVYPLLLSSGAVFLASIYTEPLFLALASMVMYFSEKKWWGRAVLLTALATSTRVNGVFLALFLLVKMLGAKLTIRQVIAGFLLSLSGIFSYMTYLFYTTGDALNWYHSQGAWGKATPTSPLTTAISYLKAISIEFSWDLTHLVVIIEVVTTLVALALFITLLRAKLLDLAYWLYLGFNLAMPIITGSLGSMPRFFLILFPILVVIPTLSPFKRSLYYSYSLVVSIVGIILFTRGYWYG